VKVSIPASDRSGTRSRFLQEDSISTLACLSAPPASRIHSRTGIPETRPRGQGAGRGTDEERIDHGDSGRVIGPQAKRVDDEGVDTPPSTAISISRSGSAYAPEHRIEPRAVPASGVLRSPAR